MAPAFEDLYKLSPIQKGMLFHSLYSPEAGIYFEQFSWAMPSQIDAAALERAWRQVIRRHPILRSSFHWENLDEPLQMVHAEDLLPVQWRDWRAVPPAERQSRLAAFLEEDRRRGFDLATPPLMRLTLLQLEDELYQLVWSYHHLLLDGWSAQLVLHEAETLYAALAQGRPVSLPRCRPYRDYISWLRQQDLAAAASFWQRHLQGVTAATVPAIDRLAPGAVSTTTAYDEQVFFFSASETAALQLFAQQHRLTMNTLIQGTWALLLSRYSGDAEVVFGVTVSGRPASLAGSGTMVGMFINTIPMRVAVRPELTLLSWLEQIQQQQGALLQYEYTPLNEIQGWSEVPRGQPLFESIVVFENYPANQASRPREVHIWQRTNYPLTLTAEVLPDLKLALAYACDRFDASDIARLLQQLRLLLGHIRSGAAARLGDLPSISATEWQQLRAWNGGPLDHQADQCIHTVFEAQARRTPHAPAVRGPAGSLSYAQLDARANQVAHQLRRLGVGPDWCVGLYLERSTDLVIGLLGILKAGGAYIPLDPALPPERLALILDDAQIAVLITREGLLPQLPERSLRTLCLDRDQALLQSSPEHAPASAVSPQHLAYVIYTSGSTGQPKGVQVAHEALVAHTHAVAQRYQLAASDRLLQFTSFSSDIATEDLWVTWFSGATVVLWPEAGGATFEAFSAFVEREAITVLNMPTVYWQEWVGHLADSHTPVPPALRLLIVGTEQISASRLATWRQLTSATVRTLNGYGLTETTITATVYEITDDPDTLCQLRTVPIGRPLANTQVYLLDRQLQPVPIGAPGELYIGGTRLARGYQGRPDLTAERFIPNPFAAPHHEMWLCKHEAHEGHEEHEESIDQPTQDQLILDNPPASQRHAAKPTSLKPQASSLRHGLKPQAPSLRLYATGDLARYRADGNLEFLGRSDLQVKVRGFRIEPGEIEAALRRHPQIQTAVVLAREDVPGVKQLVAYLVAADTATAPAGAELRAFLKQRLPDYMVPTAFIAIERLPLTPSGKIDRRALPAPQRDGQLQADAFAAPRTAIEQTLAAIWAEVLRVEQVGLHDNFFALGGDSILSLQIIARANRAGLRLTPLDVFQRPTIAELALVTGTPLVAATQQAVTGPVPLTPIQHWFLAQQLPEPHHFNQSVLLEIRQPLEPAVLEQALQRLLAHHDALRMRFQHNGEWRQVGTEVADQAILSQLDLRATPVAERPSQLAAALAAQQASLDLQHGPLVWALLIHTGDDQPQRLALIIHHLVVDGVSWRILLEDLQTACEQLCRGAEVALPAKTSAFAAWAERLVRYAPSQEHQLEHWRATLAGPAARLPVDLPQGANTTASAQTVTTVLDAETTRALLRDVPLVYRTQINDVLLTALAQTLATWTDTSAVLIDLEGHGRVDLFDDIDLSRTVGWFTTLYPVRLEVQRQRNLGEALKAVKQQLRSIPQQGIGYGLLRYLSSSAAITSQLAPLPQPQIMFNYLGQADQVSPETGRFGLVLEDSGPAESARGLRSHLLAINAIVAGEQLRVSWSYSDALHQRATIERLAASFRTTLEALIAHCLAPEAGGYSPTDFPLANLDQATLDRLAGSRRDLEDIYPLTPVQQGMLFHTLYDQSAGVYVEQLSFSLHGRLDRAAFVAAWERTIQRHPIFRTGFAWEQLSAPLQLVYRQLVLPWTIDDWRGLTADEQTARRSQLLADDRVRGFDLTRPPLQRLTLLQLADDAHEVLWSCHHIVLDGWSLPLVLREVFAEYSGHSAQIAQARPFHDYIAWLQRQDRQQAESFWRQALAGFGAAVPLAVGQAPAANQSAGAPAEQHLQLPEPTTAALQALCRQHGLTLNTIIQGAWALVLGRYSGQDDLVFGATVAGRPTDLPGAETMVGLFINTLPVRVRLAAGQPVLHWLQQLQAQQLELRRYEYSALVDIQGWSEVPRGQPLFESIVVFENYPVDTALAGDAGDVSGGLRIGSLRVMENTNYPLTLIASAWREVSLRLLYDSQRFAAIAIERLLGHLHTLLEGIAAAPQRRLADLPLLTEAERQQYARWNATDASYPDQLGLHQLVEAQAQQTPGATAVLAGTASLSYRALNEQADRLALSLRRLGVGPDSCVGICLERSPELAVAVLGVLKAGGACVPLDPAYPRERLALMVADSHMAVLLTQSSLLDRLPAHQAAVLCLDQQTTPPAQEWALPAAAPLLPDQLAYVIYTSGSTGRPKGVAMTHRALTNLIAWQRHTLRARPNAVTLQYAPLSFDVAFQELFVTWSNGGTLVLVPEALRRDMAELRQLLETARVERLFLPYVALQQLAISCAAAGRAPATLREIITAGEQLTLTEPIVQLLRQLPGCTLHNQYGPSETHVVTCHTLAGAPADWPLLPPIGQPVANTQIYLLDAQLRQVPVGVPGELYVAGASLARGYLDRPELTAERFVPNPFAAPAERFAPSPLAAVPRTAWGVQHEAHEGHEEHEEQDSSLTQQHTALDGQPASQDHAAHLTSLKPLAASLRLYRTGDLARYRHDGAIEFLGRADFQVKLRGFRIELGEIEAVLMQHPAIGEAVTLVREDVPGDQRLVAYCVPKQAGQLEQQSALQAELRPFLSDRLPAYMLPATFVFIAALPLTPSGKVNRAALLAPDAERPALESAYAAPRTPLEEQLAAIWARVLGVAQVGIHDNFFALGGHSLLATQVASWVQSEFHVEVPLRTLFAEPTVARLAEAIIEQELATTDSALLAEMLADLQDSHD